MREKVTKEDLDKIKAIFAEFYKAYPNITHEDFYTSVEEAVSYLEKNVNLRGLREFDNEILGYNSQYEDEALKYWPTVLGALGRVLYKHLSDNPYSGVGRVRPSEDANDPELSKMLVGGLIRIDQDHNGHGSENGDG